MPEYDCQVVLASKIHAGFNKFQQPLCSSCINRGCTNTIVEEKISVFGIIHTTKLLKTYNATFMVVDCEGYIREDEDHEEEVEEDEV